MKDFLNRQPYIDLLKSVIKNQTEKKKSFSAAIDGDWGCGKTWVLYELEKQLSDNSEYLIFHFNAWQNDFYEEPLIAILSVMIESLKLQKKNVKEKGTVGKVFTTAITTLTKVSGLIIGSKLKVNPNDIIDSVKETGKAIADVKLSTSDFNKMLSLENALKQIKDVIIKLSEKKTLIIVVDELDRCLPEYAIKVLERLHHICNEMPIIQILAINKKDLSFGITKVFGMINPEIDREKFADKYLQKFIQLVIPLNNGKLNEEENILHGIDEGFTEVLSIDKSYLIDFYKKIMNEITPRTQEYICKQVSLAHQLTVLSGHEMKYYSYGLLCCEILYCIKYCILRDKSDFRIWHEDGVIFTLKSCTEILKCEIINPRIFFFNLDSIFRKEYQILDYIQLSPRTQDKQISAFVCDNGSSQLLNYFVPTYNVTTKWPPVYLMDEVFNSEREFLKYYKEILKNF